jgi:hypothetical protein
MTEFSIGLHVVGGVVLTLTVLGTVMTIIAKWQDRADHS